MISASIRTYPFIVLICIFNRNTKAKTENSVMRLPERGEAMDVYLYEAPQHQHRLATDDPELIDIRGASKSDSNSDPHSSRTIFEI